MSAKTLREMLVAWIIASIIFFVVQLLTFWLINPAHAESSTTVDIVMAIDTGTFTTDGSTSTATTPERP